MMNAMMHETLVTGTAKKADIPGWSAAGKTGTSQDFRDAWFIGYTANLVTGVWLGNDDNSPTKKATGGGLPVEVWTRFMRAAHQNVPAAPSARLDAAAGRIPLESFPGSVATRVARQRRRSRIRSRPAIRATSHRRRTAQARVSAGPAACHADVAAGQKRQRGLDGWLIDRVFGGRR